MINACDSRKIKNEKNSNFNPPNMNKINPNVNYNQIPYKIPPILVIWILKENLEILRI